MEQSSSAEAGPSLAMESRHVTAVEHSSSQYEVMSEDSLPSNPTWTMFDDNGRYGYYYGPLARPHATAETPIASVESGPSDAKRFEGHTHEERLEVEQPPRVKLRPSRTFKGKGKEAATEDQESKKSLQLLSLPMDILTAIVREVTHTNDLTALALSCRALHTLAIPHIYSRFDIVWPDAATHNEPRTGVDALTYGLATLVMAEEIFDESPDQIASTRRKYASEGPASALEIRRRRGNHYAQFTKKFSLGNGPADWVQEYLITKEGGKMLGTLVALAIARMRSLETFIWDMPTGILRDVWNALASLGDSRGNPKHVNKLDKVWIRWHDNRTIDPRDGMSLSPPPLGAHVVGAAPAGTSAGASYPIPSPLDRVERPSFSDLPPLKSLSVLEIDELPYLDEMAVLIGRSIEKMRELRVGIARHANTREWTTVWEGDSLSQVDYDNPTAGAATIGEQRLGGIMGVLTGFVCDLRSNKLASPQAADSKRADGPLILEVVSDDNPGVVLETHVLPPLAPENETAHAASDGQAAVESVDRTPEAEHDKPTQPPVQRLKKTLQIETLELERLPLSVPVLQQAFDWAKITTLTLLNCHNHEVLWKTLRKVYAPTPTSPIYPQPRRTPLTSPRKSSRTSSVESEYTYFLNLKKLHTNTVSPALITFLKETLRPNSLEVLFLQDDKDYYNSSVTVESIYRGPLRRHRASLKKLLIDSSDLSVLSRPERASTTSRSRKWMLHRDASSNKDVLSFICSGKMPALRELGMVLRYDDWHYFLQSLPNIPHLRSISISQLVDHPYGSQLEPKDLAMQILDIVALRSDVELCYMGLANKCFEIMENRKDNTTNGRHFDGRTEIIGGMSAGGTMDDESEADDDADDDDADDDEDDDDVAPVQHHPHDEDDEEDTETDTSTDDDDDDDDSALKGSRSTAPRLRLREILFYDDKVAIFKARHGRL